MNRGLILLLSAIALVSCKPKQQTTENKVVDTTPNITVVNNGDVKFDSYFKDKTMRLDYFHSGTSTEEHFAVDQIVNDGVCAGSKMVMIDKL